MQELYENRSRKNALLREMLTLLKLQKEQLMNDDVEALLKTTEEWKRASVAVDELEEQSGNIVKLALLKGARISEYPSLQTLHEEARQLLLHMQEEQQASEEAAFRKIEEYKTDLKDAKKSNQRLISYSNPYGGTYDDGIYFDKRQ